MAPKKSPPPPPNPVAAPSSPSDDLDAEYLSATASIPSSIEDDEQPAAEGQQGSEPVDNVFPYELVAGALRPTFNAMFGAVASVRGDHWKLKQFEEDGLVVGWTPLVQHLLAKLGSTETQMLILAVGSTMAIVGGKVAQDATRRASKTANTRTPVSGASSASSASEVAARQPAPAEWPVMPPDA